ncbi:MAG: DUF4832 domain-containing protein [Cytophagaceae bacterium]|nr:DUF4832 domain-containing protein [Cytophagaceae bacterium]
MKTLIHKTTTQKKYSYLKNKYKIASPCFGITPFNKLWKVFLFLMLFHFEATAQTTTVNYTYDASNFCNPERGFYKYSEYPGGVGTLATYRGMGYTLLYRIYYLDKNSLLSATVLNDFNNDMQTIRSAGMKCVLRFAYTKADANDAPLARVLEHLNQLQPYLQSNSDVIAVFQAGFIGRWGEWYYTNNFGDQGNINATDWNNRKAVVDRELQIMPTDRTVSIRYCWQKRIMYNRTAPITLAEAFNGSAWSRIGYYNDGFMAAWDDWGTFPGGQADRDFLAAESTYLPSGGESESGDQSLNGCTNTMNQMTSAHFTYVDRDYNLTTINKWSSEGCFATIEKKMGYRFYLTNGTYANSVKPGGTFTLNMNLTNEGYAAPINRRLVEIVLKNKADGKVCKFQLNVEPRKWLPGTINLNESIGIPANYPPGTYDVYLNLPDPATSLYGRPEYSIRLANTGVWDGTTGYNDLGFDLVISNSVSGIAYTGTQWFDACYGSNAPPTVAITSPADNSAFVTGSNITFNANATDDGSVTKVEFYSGATKIGEDLTGPYSFTWTSVPNGVYTITAKAIDNFGLSTTSTPITITVNAAGNAPPVVSITAPTNGQNFTPGSNITINANASDPNGSVTKVEFFYGATKIGEDLTGPYSIVWNSVPAGNYSLTAVATDNNGLTTVSSAVNITVSAMVMCSTTGTILREVWTGVTGTTVSSVNWSSAPNSFSNISTFEAPTDYSDNYGQRLRGYICPPATGNYTFYIASDDQSELWLSTDQDPLNKVKIASVTGWTNSREWNKYPSQQSVTISLVANRKYYVEALHKDDLWGDNLAVGWTTPSNSTITVIPGSNLSPFDNTNLPVTISSFAGWIDGSSVCLKWITTSEKNNSYFNVERSNDGITYEIIGQIPGNNNSSQIISYQFEDDSPMIGTNYYKLSQVDADGAISYVGLVLIHFAKEEQFFVYPNPSSGIINLEIILNSPSYEIEVYNSLGIKVYSEGKNEVNGMILLKTLDLSYLSSGIYFVHVTTQSHSSIKKLYLKGDE